MDVAAVDAAWQTVATWRVRLRGDVQLFEHVYRGTPWLIIADDLNRSYFRGPAAIRRFLDLLDGRRTVAQAHQQLAEDDGAPTPSRHDLLELLEGLRAADLLQGTGIADTGRQAQRQLSRALRLRWQRWRHPLMLRLPLYDPDRLLGRCAAAVGWLFRPANLYAWLLLVAVAVLTGWLHRYELAEHATVRFADPANWIWIVLLYLPVKLLHEAGHGLATKHWGGRVGEIGIQLLVLIPVPYVDASASYRFASKHRRMLVGAAGIIVEVTLAALALLAWVNLDPGLARDIAFDILVIGGVSSVLFNGNPLLRFDGYYVLADYLESPNLATRSTQYLGYLLKRHVVGLQRSRRPVVGPGERGWLVFYGIASGLYRIAVGLSIALWVAESFPVVGVALAVWVLVGQFLYPAAAGLWRTGRDAAAERRLGHLGAFAGGAAVAIALVLLLPIPQATVAQGIVMVPQDALLRAATDGRVAAVLRRNGDVVAANEPLLQLENAAMREQLAILDARARELAARRQQAAEDDRTRAAALAEELRTVQGEIADLQQRLDGLLVRAPVDGVVSLPRAEDLPGRHLKQGALLGFVASGREAEARVVVDQASIARIRRATDGIVVMARTAGSVPMPATLVRALPASTDKLPSPLLGSQRGGIIPVDARDESGTTTVSDVFRVDVALRGDVDRLSLGQVVLVKFVHAPASLTSRLKNWLQQYWLDWLTRP